MAFTPFMQSTEAQSIIDNYLTNPTTKQNTGVFRNPQYDLRTEQGLPADAQFPNPQIDFSAEKTPTDPCPEGYMLVDGVCQPIETFGKSMYDEKRDRTDRDERDEEERPYMSIEDMKNASDYELLNYLTDGLLANSKLGFLESKLGNEFYLKKAPPNVLTMGLGLLGLNNSKLRRDFVQSELAKRGYDLNTKQGQLGLTQAMGIISNAQNANKGGNRLATNQPSIFTPEEINYQIQAKKDAQDIINQGGNPYGQSFSGNAQQIHDQVVQNAIQSGGTVNPFEAQNINSYTAPKPPFAVNYEDVYGADI